MRMNALFGALFMAIFIALGWIGSSQSNNRDLALEQVSQPAVTTEVPRGEFGQARVVKVEDVYVPDYKHLTQFGPGTQLGFRRAIILETKGEKTFVFSAIVLPGIELQPGQAVRVINVRSHRHATFMEEFWVAIPY